MAGGIPKKLRRKSFLARGVTKRSWWDMSIKTNTRQALKRLLLRELHELSGEAYGHS